MIGFNRRFDPNIAALKAALDKGEIGKPDLLSITSFAPAPPLVAYIKVSGGLFRDMMIHDFDMANFIMGAAPVSVFATGSSIVDPAIGESGDVDTSVVTVSYADGRIAVIKTFAGRFMAMISGWNCWVQRACCRHRTCWKTPW